jgi:hypothetical protein
LGIQSIAARLVPTYIQNLETKVLINSGASGNFITKAEVTRLGFYKVLIKPLEASRADGKALYRRARTITYFMLPETIMIRIYQETIIFYILYILSVPIILGRSWLKKHKPTIDWKTFQPIFEQCQYTYQHTFKEVEFRPVLQ